MGRIKDYCIVTGVGQWQLEEIVRARLAEGWEPVGAAQMFEKYDKQNWRQTMALREVDNEEGSD